MPENVIEGEAGTADGSDEDVRQPFRLFYNPHRDTPELAVFEAGWEGCESGHEFGPATRSYYILHYIVHGKGVYSIEGKTFNLGAGEMFLIPPETETFYKADDTDPWYYYWVGFHGSSAAKLLPLAGLLENGVYTAKASRIGELDKYFRELCRLNERRVSDSYALLGNLYIILSFLINKREKKSAAVSEGHINKALAFMSEQFATATVIDVVNYVGLERTYFSRIFKQKMRVSPQEWLNGLKIDRAKMLLKDTDLPFREIADTVGYADYPNFSRQFKKKTGYTVSEYKKLPAERDYLAPESSYRPVSRKRKK